MLDTSILPEFLLGYTLSERWEGNSDRYTSSSDVEGEILDVIDIMDIVICERYQVVLQ